MPWLGGCTCGGVQQLRSSQPVLGHVFGWGAAPPVRMSVASGCFLSTVARQAESARSEGQLSPNDRDVAQPGLCGRRQARSGQQGN